MIEYASSCTNYILFDAFQMFWSAMQKTVQVHTEFSTLLHTDVSMNLHLLAIAFVHIAIDNVQVSAFFHIFNCSCHVDQNVVNGSLLNSLTPQNI